MDIMQGLVYLREKGFIHGDLLPCLATCSSCITEKQSLVILDVMSIDSML
ncbi:hypothetical protein ACE6H2_025585 [Prunus campanulata]